MLGRLSDRTKLSLIDSQRNWHSIWPKVFEFKVGPATKLCPHPILKERL